MLSVSVVLSKNKHNPNGSGRILQRLLHRTLKSSSSTNNDKAITQQHPASSFATSPFDSYRSRNHAIALPSSFRSYSSSTCAAAASSKGGGGDKGSDDDDKDGDNEEYVIPIYETLNNDQNLTNEQLDAIVRAEEKKMEDKLKAKFLPNWKPGMRKRPLKKSFTLEEFQYELEPEKYPKRWTLLDKRCGLLGIKVGMIPVFDTTWGMRYPCTVLYIDNNIVLGHKTMEKNGYSSLQIGAGERKIKNVGKSILGQYKHVLNFDALTNNSYNANNVDDLDNDEDEETDINYSNESLITSTARPSASIYERRHPPYIVREFRITDEENLIPIGQPLNAMHFVPGQNVDIAGISKGKGFQGGMKRHNFKGMPASHGTSLSHRAIGSTGQCQDPGRVFKGKKMPGRMGSDRITTQNLRIVKIDRGRNLIYVLGAVPGNAGNFVEIRDAIKKPLWKTPKVLAEVDRPPLPTYEYDPAVDGTGLPGHDVFMPMPMEDPLMPNDDVPSLLPGSSKASAT